MRYTRHTFIKYNDTLQFASWTMNAFVLCLIIINSKLSTWHNLYVEIVENMLWGTPPRASVELKQADLQPFSFGILCRIEASRRTYKLILRCIR